MASDTRTLKVVIAGDAKSARAALKTLGAGLEEADKDAKKHKASWDSYWRGVNKVLAGVALGVAGAAVGFTALGIKTASALEQSQVGFTTMLGSAEKAKSFMQELQRFAASTPFELQGVTQSSQRLLAMGFAAHDVIPTLTAIGDSVAALGGNQETLDRVVMAIGQIKSKGKLQAEEMLQLTEAGIPAWQMLADKIGTDIPTAMDKVTKGAVSSDVAVSALTEGMNKRFGGLMEKQSHTMAGMWSNLKDTLSLAAAKMVEPLVPLIEKWMPKLISFAERSGQVIATKAVPAIATAVKYLGAMATFIKQNSDWLTPLVIVLGTAAAGIYIVVTAMKAWAAIQAVVNLLMDSNPIGAIIIAIVALAAGIAYLWKHNETFRKIVIAVWNVLKATVMGVVNWFKTEVPKAWHFVSDTAVTAWHWMVNTAKAVWAVIVSTVMTPIRFITNMVKFYLGILRAIWEFIWSAIGDNVKQTWARLHATIQRGINNIRTTIQIVLGVLRAIWEFVWSVIGDKVKIIWALIVAGVKFAIDLLTASVRFGLSVIQAVWSAVWGFVKDSAITVWTNTVSFISGAINTVWSAIKGVLTVISSAWSTAWNGTKAIISAAWSYIKDAAISGIWNLLHEVSAIPNKIMDALGNLKDLLYDAGKKIIQGLIDGIKFMADKVKDAVGNVLEGAKNLLPHSPAKEGPFSGKGWTLYSGQSISEGLADGIRMKAPMVKAAMSMTMGLAHTSIGDGLAGTSLGGASVPAGVTVNVHVAGTVTAERDLAKAIAGTVRDEIARKGKRNGGRTGL